MDKCTQEVNAESFFTPAGNREEIKISSRYSVFLESSYTRDKHYDYPSLSHVLNIDNKQCVYLLTDFHDFNFPILTLW